jgi:membrane protein
MLLVLVTYGFAAYVRTLADDALFYGSAAAVATLLVWLYLSSLALLVGAEVNAQLEGVRRRDVGASTPP